MENLGGEISLRRGRVGVGQRGMTELVGVTGGGYEEISGPGPASWGGTRDWRVRGRTGRVEFIRVRVGRAPVASEPGELAAGVDDHGDVLRRSSDGEGDGESNVVVEMELVGGSGHRPGWCYPGLQRENESLRGCREACLGSNEKKEKKKNIRKQKVESREHEKLKQNLKTEAFE